MVLALLVARAIFTPAPVGAGITSEITSVGPIMSLLYHSNEKADLKRTIYGGPFLTSIGNNTGIF